MKNIIAELDKITAYLEDFDEPWAFQLVWRLDRVAQQLEQVSNQKTPTKVSNKVLTKAIEQVSFNTDTSQLTQLIKSNGSKNASQIYTALKKNFGSLSKKESIQIIKNILDDSKKKL